MQLPYFILKGTNSKSMGVMVSEYPPITRPKQRRLELVIPGRSGSLSLPEAEYPVYEAYTRPFECYLEPGASIDTVFGWLSGWGDLIVGNEPNRRYEARVVDQIDMHKVVRGRQHKAFTLVFAVQPFKFLHPAAADIVMSGSSAIITNPGNAVAMPAITVSGTGAGTVTINGTVVSISNLANGILMDWKAMEITTPSLSANRASYVTGGPQYFLPGPNTITRSAAVTYLKIQPNWGFV